MCGIAGYIDFTGSSIITHLKVMVDSLNHRGPDDKGTKVLTCGKAQVGLGHARLSIIDLSPAGHQPMSYEDICIVFNGEIYNYKEIRFELLNKGYSFVSDSDTEVIIHAYREWGEKCVEHFIGMFAFVLLDESKKEVYFFRDRAGVKPLYIYENDGLLLFGSELKALMAHPGFMKDIDKSVLPTYLSYGYVPAPNSIFKRTKKLMPGSVMTYSLNERKKRVKSYWNIAHSYKQSKLDSSYEEAKSQLHELLKSAYNYRMVSDVPVGGFLSGGYDSTSVAAILSKTQKEKLNTFTIGFHEGNNEAPQAKEIANHLGTKHTELYCTQDDAKRLVERLPEIYDEPFADSSAIPTALVSAMAKEHVSVALSADGGDEQFFGYGHGFKQYSNVQVLKRAKRFGLGSPLVTKPLKSLVDLVPIGNQIKYQARSAISSLSFNSQEMAENIFIKSKQKPAEYINRWLLNNVEEVEDRRNECVNMFHNEADVFSYLDYINYLPNDILTKVDRATMSVSLEGREPMLDHRIAEFAAKLPLDFKFDEKKGSGKRILKDIVHEYIPKEIMDKPKRGFSVPVLKWLKNDLKFLLEIYLSEESLIKTNTFNPAFVQNELKRFLSGEMHYTPIIWYVLMYQMWYFKWIK